MEQQADARRFLEDLGAKEPAWQVLRMTRQRRQETEDAARAAWPDIARRAGLDPEAQILAPLRTRVVDDQVRSVFTVDGPGHEGLILKHTTGESADWFDSQVEAHRRAETAFAGRPDLRVPRLLMADCTTRILLMERVGGMTAHDAMLLAVSGAARLEILRACGRWAGHLHRSGDVKFGRVRPEPLLRLVSGWRAEAGTLDIPDRDTFVALADQTIRMAEAARGRKTTRVVVHGDLSLRNIMVEAGEPTPTVTGIDFGTTGLKSPAVDLARVLVMHATFFGPAQGAGDADDFEAARGALLDGHGGRWRDTVELDHLVRQDVLRIWLSIPRAPWSRSLVKVHRWRGIARLAAALLAEDQGASSSPSPGRRP